MAERPLIMELPPDAGPVARLLAQEGAWTQCNYARDKDGLSADYWGHEACCWCLSGAVRREYPDDADSDEVFLRISASMDKPREIILWNDDPSRTQKEVVELCLKAGV